ncbi:hypothetical protein AB833_21715 [Chromatiales bacterium (ex Bugula neritina AB1)]|nr:hypothetical protein AB833_21715 [Chromatiales bacterium (ex Bugula neritina AB1)]
MGNSQSHATNKEPPLTKYTTLERAAEWLSNDDRVISSENLLHLAIERKLVLSLEFVDPDPANVVDIEHLMKRIDDID